MRIRRLTVSGVLLAALAMSQSRQLQLCDSGVPRTCAYLTNTGSNTMTASGVLAAATGFYSPNNATATVNIPNGGLLALNAVFGAIGNYLIVQGVAAQIDGTNLDQAFNINGSGSTNGNIVLNPGAVAANASVVINALRLDEPALYLNNPAGTTTGNIFEIRDSSSAVKFKVIGSGDSGCANCVVSGSHYPLTTSTYELGTSANKWLGVTADTVTGATIIGTTVISTTTVGTALVVSGTIAANPTFTIIATDAGANQGKWQTQIDATHLYFRAYDDTVTSSTDWLQVLRSGYTVSDVTFPTGTVHTNAILATSTNTYALGDASHYWSQLYTANITVSGSAGLTTTKTVRNAANSGSCTLAFSAGVLTGGTC